MARGLQGAHASQSPTPATLTVQVRITILPHAHARGRTAHVSRLLQDARLHTNQPAALLPQLSSRTRRLCFLAAHRAVVALVCSMPTNSQNDSSLRTSRLIIAIHHCSQALTTMLRTIRLETRNQS